VFYAGLSTCNESDLSLSTNVAVKVCFMKS